MGRYNKTKPVVKGVAKKQPIEPVQQPIIVKSSHKKNIIYLIIVLFAFVFYGNTVLNDYSLDDAIVITQNDYTQKGIAGIKDIFSTELFTGFFKVKKDLVVGGRYRPLSVATFALEIEFFGQNPYISHFINVLLFGLIGIILYKILDRLFRKYKINDKWYSNIPLIATLLYLAHPIHTEVVANIKGRDELLSLLGVFIAFFYTLKYLENKNSKFLIFSFFGFLGSMFSKEIGVTFLVTIPLAIWFFTDSKWKNIFISLLPILASTLIYFIIRGAVLGDQTAKVVPELMNDSFLYMTAAQKFATITYTMGIYLKLIFFPHPLTYDYYPYHIPITEWSHWHAFGSLIIIIVLAVIAFRGLKHKTVISFGILFYAISLAPVSNILFPIGAFMNERFVFVASLGFCIILAWFLGSKLPQIFKNDIRKMKIIPVLLVIIFVLYGFKTITRNTDWKNDFTLFTTDVQVSVNGAKSNCSAGGKLIEEAIKPENKDKRNEYLKKAIKYLNHSLEIYPAYGDALLLLGNAWFEYDKNYDSTLVAYKTLLRLNPNHNQVFTNLEIVFRNLDSVDYKIKVYRELYEINPNRYEINYTLGNLFGRYKNDIKTSMFYLNKAVSENPKSAVAMKDLGVAYGMSMKYDSSVYFFKKAAEIEPNDAQIYLNIGISYMNTNQKEEAAKYFEKAKVLDPKINVPH
jgi:protein O-mannosyl-transferase